MSVNEKQQQQKDQNTGIRRRKKMRSMEKIFSNNRCSLHLNRRKIISENENGYVLISQIYDLLVFLVENYNFKQKYMS